MINFLNLPERPQKPRSYGLSILIDNGYATHFYEDIIKSHGHLIDYIKFGWATSYITKDIVRKINFAKDAGIEVFFGGTFFEKVIVQDKLNDYLKLLETYKISVLEVSNGTIPLSNKDKCAYIKRLANHFKVLSEVGYKDCEQSNQLTNQQWIDYIQEDLSAGAHKVITETRESGSAGICDNNGELKNDIIHDILNAAIDPKDLIFEAPSKKLQEYFIKLIGPNVNLANIAFLDIIPLETLRLGLRSDTLMTFESEEAYADS